jgi:hypothetical protein
LSKRAKRAAGEETIFMGSYGRAEAVLISASNSGPEK